MSKLFRSVVVNRILIGLCGLCVLGVAFFVLPMLVAQPPREVDRAVVGQVDLVAVSVVDLVGRVVQEARVALGPRSTGHVGHRQERRWRDIG